MFREASFKLTANADLPNITGLRMFIFYIFLSVPFPRTVRPRIKRPGRRKTSTQLIIFGIVMMAIRAGRRRHAAVNIIPIYYIYICNDSAKSP